MTGPLSGLRVLEYAQYVAGPLCGVLLADLGAEVVKVEPPGGDGYRHVMPVAPGTGRFFLPLNRGKRSVVLDLKSEGGRAASARLLATADVVLHNSPPGRAAAFGLDWELLHAVAPGAVVGLVTSFGSTGPLAGTPAYDLIAQARSGLLTSHASPGDRVPVRAGGIPMADLTAGFLLSSAVLAALVRARATGVGELVQVSLLEAALAVQLQDLVWLERDTTAGNDAADAADAADDADAAGAADAVGEGAPAAGERATVAGRGDLEARAAEIAEGVAMNPYYRCYEAADGFVAVACLNLAQRRSFLALFDLEDPTIHAPDVVPDDPAVLEAKVRLTTEVARRIAERPAADWLERFERSGVAAGPVLVRESVDADPQVAASGLVSEVAQPGVGTVRLLAPLLSSGALRQAAPAPELGADTEAVLGELG